MQTPPKGFYYHYKHDPAVGIHDYAYEVIGVGLNTEERSLVVLYRALYPIDDIKPAEYFSRPLEMFIETVTKDEKTFPRFEHITDPELVVKLTEIRDFMYN